MLYWVAYALLFFLARPFSKIALVGRENIPRSGPVILAANHQRYWDIPLVGLIARRHVYFMAKADFFGHPLKKLLLRLAGAFSVRRENPDIGAISRAIKILKNGGAIGIFPEGRLMEGNPGNLKGGFALIAARAKVPVIPIKIKYTKRESFFPQAEIVCGKPILSGNRRLVAYFLQQRFDSL